MVLVDGSPAHAGMVPSAGGGGGISPWFPRTRGDGPTRRLFARVAHPVPPPTRRSASVAESIFGTSPIPAIVTFRVQFAGLPRD